MKNSILLDLVILGITAILLLLSNIRFCPFYNIFKIPCPGCGLTRAFLELVRLNFKQAIKYNFLSIPVFFIILYLLLPNSFKPKQTLKAFLIKHKTLVIIITIILVIVEWIVNINNELLY